MPCLQIPDRWCSNTSTDFCEISQLLIEWICKHTGYNITYVCFLCSEAKMLKKGFLLLYLHIAYATGHICMSLCSGTADFKSNLLPHCNSLVFRFLVQLSTLCLKKVPTCNMSVSVTLSNLNQFSVFAPLQSVWNLLQVSYETTHLTLGMLWRISSATNWSQK